MNQYLDKIGFILQDAHGEIPYGMTNDYMFRAVLQSNNKVLRGLICSLLHLSESEVNSVMYLCRSFDQLNHGQSYGAAKPAIHIAFLDYTLFQERPEFYASYKLINVKNYEKYSDSLTLYVLDLSRIDLATEEDKQYHIQEWAKLFKATTWEEIKMLAAKDEYLQEAAETIFQLSADELIRKRCCDREEYYQDLRNYERVLAEQEEKIERDRIEHEQDLRNYERALAERDSKIRQLLAEIESLKAQN